MKLYITNQIHKYIIVFLMEFLLVGCLYITNDRSVFECYNVLLGNEPFIRVLDRMGFIILVLLVQVLNGNIIIYYLKSRSYFYVRHVTDKKMVSNIVSKVLFNLAIFMGMHMMVLVFLNHFFYQRTELLVVSSVLLSVVKGFGKLFVLTCIQIILFILFSEDKAFLGFILCLMIFSFCNFKRGSTTLQNEYVAIFIGAIIYILLSMSMVMIINKLYRKEIWRNGY